MQKELKLKIISDGTSSGTKVIDQNGNVLPNIKRIVMIADTEQTHPSVLIELNGELPVEIEANATVIQPSSIIQPKTIITGNVR